MQHIFTFTLLLMLWGLPVQGQELYNIDFNGNIGTDIQVATDLDGNALVVWNRQFNGKRAIVGCILTRENDGGYDVGAITRYSGIDEEALSPTVAFSPAKGQFLIAYHSVRVFADEKQDDIRGRFVHPDGQTEGLIVEILPGVDDDYSPRLLTWSGNRPSAAANPTHFLLAWNRIKDDALVRQQQSGVYVAPLDHTGNISGDMKITINTVQQSNNSVGKILLHDMAMDPKGRIFLAGQRTLSEPAEDGSFPYHVYLVRLGSDLSVEQVVTREESSNTPSIGVLSKKLVTMDFAFGHPDALTDRHMQTYRTRNRLRYKKRAVDYDRFFLPGRTVFVTNPQGGVWAFYGYNDEHIGRYDVIKRGKIRHHEGERFMEDVGFRIVDIAGVLLPDEETVLLVMNVDEDSAWGTYFMLADPVQ